MKKKHDLGPYLYILPAAIIVIAFRLLPILLSFIISFFQWTIRGPEQFIGFQNYQTLLTDLEFWQSMINTLHLVIFVVPITLVLSLFFANLLNQNVKLSGFFRSSYFLPSVTALVAISILWKQIFAPQTGLLNHVLGFFGIHGLNWLSEPRGIIELILTGLGVNFSGLVNSISTALGMNANIVYWIIGGPSLALFAIIIVCIWRNLGYNTIIYLAGLQNIPDVYYEAAEIDGASKFKQFFKITLPLISPTTFYILIMTTITTFQVFSQVYLMTGPPIGGPLGTTKVIVYYIFDKGFGEAQNLSYASAIALVLFVIILCLTLLQRRFESRVHY